MRLPYVTVIGAIIIAAAVGTGIYLPPNNTPAPPPPPPGPTIPNANLWIAPISSASGQTCTRSISKVTLSTATSNGWLCAATQSFDQAYGQAQYGDYVGVATGAYSPQQINYSAAKSSTNCNGYVDNTTARPTMVITDCILFEPGDNQTPTFASSTQSGQGWHDGGITVEGNDVYLNNFNFGSGYYGGGLGFTACDTGPNTTGYDIAQNITMGQGGIHYGGPITHVAIYDSTMNSDNNFAPATITNATNGSSTTFTTASGHGIPTIGGTAHVFFTGATGGWAGINDTFANQHEYPVTVVDDTHFSVNFDSTSAGSFAGQNITYHVISTGNGQVNGCGGSAYHLPDHVRITGMTLENVQETIEHHVDCLHITDGGSNADAGIQDMIISNSRFLNCAEDNLEIQQANSSASIGWHDFTMENTFLAAPCSGQPGTTTIDANGGNCLGNQRSSFEIAFSSQGNQNIIVRFNTIYGGGNYDVSGLGSGVLTNQLDYGNYYGDNPFGGYNSSGFSCNTRINAGVRWDYDVYQAAGTFDTNCGTHGTIVSAQQVNISNDFDTGYNFHPLNCSVTIANYVPTAVATADGGYPTTDYAGATRPNGSALDAGAYEDC
jgi:hypothetical protein